MDLDRMIACGSLNAEETEGNKNKTNRANKPLLEIPTDPPRHAPRPPRSPPGQQQRWTSISGPPVATTMRRQRKEINANQEARYTIQEHISKQEGGIGQLRTPRTLRTGNLGDFPQLYRLDDE